MTPAQIIIGVMGLWVGLGFGFAWGWSRARSEAKERLADLLSRRPS